MAPCLLTSGRCCSFALPAELSSQAASFLVTGSDDVPCQRWRVTDGLAELDQWFHKWRTQDTSWLGDRSSPPLEGLPAAEASLLQRAQLKLHNSRLRLQDRLLLPQSAAAKGSSPPLDTR